MSADPPADLRHFTVSLEPPPPPGAPIVQGLAEDDEASRQRDAALASTYDPDHIQLAPADPRAHDALEAAADVIDAAVAVEVVEALVDHPGHEVIEDTTPVHTGGETP